MRHRMERVPTRLGGPLLIAPRGFGDERGFFCETYRRSAFAELGIPEEMVQDNHSRSARGIVRGMHFQIGAGRPSSSAARAGRSWTSSSTSPRLADFGQWEGFELSDENMRIAYCPIGFAHGFCALSDAST